MSWSDDMRCLYCDGKLPLYRKITHGQFCSAAHRKAYWQEQERLAVERLHQTHTSLKAFRPPATVESILGTDPGPAVELMPASSELIGFVPAVLYPQSQGAPRMLVADPLAYDLEQVPGKLEWAIAEPVARLAPSGGMISLLGPWSYQAFQSNDGSALPLCTELVPKGISFPTALPSLTRALLSLRESDPPAAGRVGIAVPAAAPHAVFIAPQPLPSRMPRPTQLIGMPVPPATPSVQPIPEATETQPPVAEGLFPLGGFLAHEPASQEAAGTLESLPVLTPAALPEHRFVTSVRSPGLAARVPLKTMAAAAGGSRATEIHSLDAAVAAPMRAAFALPLSEPSPAMGRGCRYPIEIRAGIAHRSVVDPLDFPSQPAEVLQLAPACLAETVVPMEEPEPEFLAPEMHGLVPLNVKLGPPVTGRLRPIVSNLATIPQPLRTEHILPKSRLEPLDEKPVSDFMEPDAGDTTEAHGSSAVKAYMWSKAAGFWKLAPRDLKLLAFAIPLLIALAAHRQLPKVHVAATPSSSGNLRQNFQNAMNEHWNNFHQALVERAAVALDEDFRSGLDDWMSRDDATAEWSFDPAGFVRPGPLALYHPSMNLSDYQVQFLGMIDKKALSWVVRATDFDNYYVLKLVVLKPGPRTTVGLTRYAVINGKAVDRVDTVVPIEAQPDTLYRVRMEVDGDDFSLGIQGQMVDSWSEPRLSRGGIGFFTGRGEESRVRWVALTHQYDMLGRLCAYLAPYD